MASSSTCKWKQDQDGPSSTPKNPKPLPMKDVPMLKQMEILTPLHGKVATLRFSDYNIKDTQQLPELMF